MKALEVSVKSKSRQDGLLHQLWMKHGAYEKFLAKDEDAVSQLPRAHDMTQNHTDELTV
jgi:hypothetical protein